VHPDTPNFAKLFAGSSGQLLSKKSCILALDSTTAAEVHLASGANYARSPGGCPAAGKLVHSGLSINDPGFLGRSWV
jgi:hypothetical protein